MPQATQDAMRMRTCSFTRPHHASSVPARRHARSIEIRSASRKRCHLVGTAWSLEGRPIVGTPSPRRDRRGTRCSKYFASPAPSAPRGWPPPLGLISGRYSDKPDRRARREARASSSSSETKISSLRRRLATRQGLWGAVPSEPADKPGSSRLVSCAPIRELAVLRARRSHAAPLSTDPRRVRVGPRSGQVHGHCRFTWVVVSHGVPSLILGRYSDSGQTELTRASIALTTTRLLLSASGDLVETDATVPSPTRRQQPHARRHRGPRQGEYVRGQRTRLHGFRPPVEPRRTRERIEPLRIENLTSFVCVVPLVVEHVPQRVSNFSGRVEGPVVVALAEELTLAAELAIEPFRNSDLQIVNAASEGVDTVCFIDEVNMIVLDAELDNSVVGTMAQRDLRADQSHEPLIPQRAKVRHELQSHVLRNARRKLFPRLVLHARASLWSSRVGPPAAAAGRLASVV